MPSTTPPSTCRLCLLRLTNSRLPDAYQHTPPSKQLIPVPCPACLGILQEPALRSAVAAIASLLPTISHASRFKINASIPPSASIIRHRALGLSAIPHATPISLREAVKWALSSRLAALGLRYCPEAELFVDLVYTHPDTDLEPTLLHQPHHQPAQRSANPPKRTRHTPNNSHSITNLTRNVDSLSDLDFRRVFPVPPPDINTSVVVTATLSSAPLLLAGNYIKSSRIVSQTPWFVDRPQLHPANTQSKPTPPLQDSTRSKRTQLSIEDVVTSGISSILNPDKTTFTAGGREDVDVRMLGAGRPFVVELVNPRTVPSLVTREIVARIAAISAQTSNAVAIENLRVVPKSYFARMRAYESEKQKHYRCVVWVAQPHTRDSLKSALEVDGGFALHQKTPLRVLHRRTQAVRERHIYEAYVVRVVNPNFFVLDLVAQAGTYIKEFVHGDNGRTIPNVANILGCDADIVQLDVTRISQLDHS